MNKFETPTEEYSDENAVKNALATGRIGFDEISVLAADEIMRQAPEGQKFIVPTEAKKNELKNQAESFERKDLVFEVE